MYILLFLMSLLLALFGTNQIDSTENIGFKQDIYALLPMLSSCSNYQYLHFQSSGGGKENR